MAYRRARARRELQEVSSPVEFTSEQKESCQGSAPDIAFTVHDFPTEVSSELPDGTGFKRAGLFDGFPLYRAVGSTAALYYSKARKELRNAARKEKQGNRWQLHLRFTEEAARESAIGGSHAIGPPCDSSKSLPFGTHTWTCWAATDTQGNHEWRRMKVTMIEKVTMIDPDQMVTLAEARALAAKEVAAEQARSKHAVAALLDRLAEEHARNMQAATIAALEQGVAYQVTRRIDLSDVGMTHITDEQLDTIARTCPDLEALFLPVGTQLPQTRLAELRKKVPRARCLALGCEISAAGFDCLLAQYSNNDEQLQSMLVGQAPGMAQAAEPQTPPHLPTASDANDQSPAGDFPDSPALQAFSRRCVSCGEEKDSECYSSNQLKNRGKTSRNKSIRCKECIANNRIGTARNGTGDKNESPQCITLDLSTPEFAGMTDAGFKEVATMCFNTTIVFLSPRTKVTDTGLNDFQECCPGVRCLALGAEVSRQSLIALLKQYHETKRIDLTRDGLSNITASGLAEIPDLCPSVEAVFTAPRTCSDAALKSFRDACYQARCVLLGREISVPEYATLEADIKHSQFVDLVGLGHLSVEALNEIGDIPAIQTVKACFISREFDGEQDCNGAVPDWLNRCACHIAYVGEENIEVRVRELAVAAQQKLQEAQVRIRAEHPGQSDDVKMQATMIEERNTKRTEFIETAEAFIAAVAEGTLLERAKWLESSGPQVARVTSSCKELALWRRMRAEAQHMLELVTEIKTLADGGEPAVSLCELEMLHKEHKSCRRKFGRAQRAKAEAQDDLDEANEAADAESAREASDDILKAELALTVARQTLHDNSRAMQAQVIKLVRLTSRHFPELMTNDEVNRFMGSGGLLGPVQRQLDDYDRLETLATNGRNELKRAIFDGRDVCLKRFPLQGDMKHYVKEIQTVQKLKHPFIIKYAAIFHDTGAMYVQMEYFPHGSLRHWVDKFSPSILQKRDVLRQLLLAIACIHSQNIVHCDLKNENVLIANDETPRLCDFEMSKDLSGSASTFFGGSPGYIAPEILSSTAKYSPASDMYAFGVVLLNALHPPAPGESYPQTNIRSLQDAYRGASTDSFQAKVQQGIAAMLRLEAARRPTAAQSLANFFEFYADMCPDNWITKNGFTCVDVSEDMGDDMTMLMLATAKQVATTSSSQSMAKARVERVLRVENHLLFEEYKRKRTKIALRLRSEEPGREFPTLSDHKPRWFTDANADLKQSLVEQHAVQYPDEDSPGINELYLWHGLPATTVLEDGTTRETWRIIAEHGFDERLGGDRHGKLFGSGCYFADASSKANQYSKTTVNVDGYHCMLRCRVLMGDPYMAKKPYQGRRPPLNEATPGLPYDSLFAEENVTVNGGRTNGGKQFHNEYVIFNGAQVYPEYAVFYTLPDDIQ